jgi:putative endonuclease
MPPKMKNSNTVTGQWGENQAATLLEARGYRIAARNYRYGRTEIDLVARGPGPDTLLVFVEVKTRKDTSWGPPEQFVNQDKMERLARAAGAYMEAIGYEWEIRFDVIAIVGNPPHLKSITHYEDVFF